MISGDQDDQDDQWPSKITKLIGLQVDRPALAFQKIVLNSGHNVVGGGGGGGAGVGGGVVGGGRGGVGGGGGGGGIGAGIAGGIGGGIGVGVGRGDDENEKCSRIRGIEPLLNKDRGYSEHGSESILAQQGLDLQRDVCGKAGARRPIASGD